MVKKEIKSCDLKLRDIPFSKSVFVYEYKWANFRLLDNLPFTLIDNQGKQVNNICIKTIDLNILALFFDKDYGKSKLMGPIKDFSNIHHDNLINYLSIFCDEKENKIYIIYEKMKKT